MRKAALLYNPDSGGKKQRQRELEAALAVLRNAGVEADLRFTQSQDHAGDETRRAVAAGLVTPREMYWAMIGTFALAFMAGLALMPRGGLPLLGVGVASIISGIAYTGGPMPLGYIGLGDFFVFVFFGPVAVATTDYVQAGHVSGLAWLAAARDRSPEVQRLFAALDQGGGHGHIRHEGWVTEEMSRRRVAYLEDPAQLDPAKRAAAIDGLKSPEASHHCRAASSRITDPDAFAVAFARGIEHPTVRAALDAKFTPGQVPRPVSLSIGDLLGPYGYRYCTGWRLQPVEGSMNAAREHRAAWIEARRQARDAAGPEPEARTAGTFAGGKVVFAFAPNFQG